MDKIDSDNVTHLSKKDGGHKAEGDSVSGLLIDPRNADVRCVPDLLLPVIHFPQRTGYVEQNDFRRAFN